MAKDYYSTLGVEKSATQDDIKKAFRKLAQKHHPDKGGDEARFKEITEAYSTLSDEKRRRDYDTRGQYTGANSGQGGYQGGFGGFGQGNMGGMEFDFSDLFSGGGFGDIFGGGQRAQARRGRDVSVDIEVSFKDSILGTSRTVVMAKVGACDTCTGTGAKKGTEVETCTHCNGAGKVHETRNSMLGTFTNVRECTQCNGSGKIPKVKCSTCSGRGVLRKEQEVKIQVPTGIDNGEMIRMPGLGEAIQNGTSGDLYIKVHVKPHKDFKKEGPHLVMSIPLHLSDALLGTSVPVTTVDDKIIDVKIPPMTTTEETLRVKGKGVPTNRGTGDLFIHLSIKMPKKLSNKARKSVEELKSEGL
jgi:molecular chaperone DnaJ